MKSEKSKRSKVDDKISHLPDNVIDIILSHLPLRNAVRTSVLSTKWRFHWTRIETLVFDGEFFSRVLRSGGIHDEFNTRKFTSVAGFIFLSHAGPIRKVIFDLPFFGKKLIPGVLNVLIRSAAQCGIQDLTLKYESDVVKCPSSVFQCTELRRLSLEYVRLWLPACNFGNLPLLRSLDLVSVDISGDILENIFLSCPLLESFRLDSETIELDCPFVIKAPRLSLLSVTCYTCPTFILKNNSISTLSLKGEELDYQKDINIFQDIVSFFGAVPNVQEIDINGLFFIQWHERDIPERLPAPLKNHRRLIIHDVEMFSPRDIYSMLCLIKSSPNLETLHISVTSMESESLDALDYFKTQVKEVIELRKLKSVRITGLMGEEREMLFIKLILSSSPVLETLYFGSSSYDINLDEKFKMMTTITRFRRASSHAELIYLN